MLRFRHYPKTTEFLKKLLDGGGKLVQISEKEELSEAPDEQVLDDKEAKIGNLHKKLNDLEQEVNDYKETETNLKFKIEMKNKRLETLEKLLTYADNRVHNLNNEIATKREFIKSNINTMVGQDRAGAYQVMPSTRLVNQNDYLEMEEKLAEYQNLNQALKCLLDVKDDQILNLEKKIENLVGQHDEVTNLN